MALQPKNIDEERQLALARCLLRVVKMLERAQDYPWGVERYLRELEVRLELRAIEDVLYSYYLGD